LNAIPMKPRQPVGLCIIETWRPDPSVRLWKFLRRSVPVAS
jgi:hypothetical protein